MVTLSELRNLRSDSPPERYSPLLYSGQSHAHAAPTGGFGISAEILERRLRSRRRFMYGVGFELLLACFAELFAYSRDIEAGFDEVGLDPKRRREMISCLVQTPL